MFVFMCRLLGDGYKVGIAEHIYILSLLLIWIINMDLNLC